jgi:hypothetical protein
MQMVKPGGRFVAVTMPNNWCGHGFYQFSPELFFRALGPENGFSVVEMYFADVEGRHFYRVVDPAAVRERVQLWTSEPVFLLVHARRDAVCGIFPACRSRATTSAGGPERIPPCPEAIRGLEGIAVLRPIRRVRRTAPAASPPDLFVQESRLLPAGRSRNLNVPRFKLTISMPARGSGWQIQKNAKTVQGEIDRAVRTVTGRRISAMRLRPHHAGVHALGQVAP